MAERTYFRLFVPDAMLEARGCPDTHDPLGEEDGAHPEPMSPPESKWTLADA